MYDIATNVVIPPRTSRPMVLPRSDMRKNRSSCVDCVGTSSLSWVMTILPMPVGAVFDGRDSVAARRCRLRVGPPQRLFRRSKSVIVGKAAAAGRRGIAERCRQALAQPNAF
ncbi:MULTISPECIES: hypothetical protein [unclassified Saccharothrix]|uniref:hypothetical protein n=1 Tax=unclassified Saccharothrix TaxID=2593673 RepID=UPI00307F7BFE